MLTKHLYHPRYVAAETDGVPVRGRVAEVEVMGDELIVYVDLNGVDLVARVDGRSGVVVGDLMDLVMDVGRSHIFALP